MWRRVETELYLFFHCSVQSSARAALLCSVRNFSVKRDLGERL